MKELRRQTRKAFPLSALLALATVAVAAVVTGCGGGDSSEKQYTLAGRVVNGNPYYNITEPRPGTKVIISRSAGRVSGSTDDNYRPYGETVADANGNFSLRVPAGLYLLSTIPPPGGNPNDGVTTPDDICSSQEAIQFPEREGKIITLGHDFCNQLPVYD